MCGGAGFDLRVSVTSAQVEAVAATAATGTGVAIPPENIVQGRLRSHVRRLDPPQFRPSYAFGRGEWSPQATLLVDTLQELLRPVAPDHAALIGTRTIRTDRRRTSEPGSRCESPIRHRGAAVTDGR
jgi:hypothetical protein